VAGTVWHGLLENDAFRRGYLADVARRCGRRFTVAPDTDFAVIRDAKLDRLADLVAENLNQELVRELLDGGAAPAGTLTLTLGPVPPAGAAGGR
jgi:adenosylcobyric acid synthase